MHIRASELQVGDIIVAHEYNFHVNDTVVARVGDIDNAHFLHVWVDDTYRVRKKMLAEGSSVEVDRG